MSWLKRHLNWSLLFGWLLTYPILIAEVFLIGLIFSSSTWEEMEPIFWLVAIPTSLIWVLVVQGWYLRQKGRSLWNLLLGFIPFGGLIILCLPNKKKRKEEEK